MSSIVKCNVYIFKLFFPKYVIIGNLSFKKLIFNLLIFKCCPIISPNNNIGKLFCNEK